MSSLLFRNFLSRLSRAVAGKNDLTGDWAWPAKTMRFRNRVFHCGAVVSRGLESVVFEDGGRTVACTNRLDSEEGSDGPVEFPFELHVIRCEVEGEVAGRDGT